MSEMQGNDLSHWNGHVDWSQAKEQLQFAMVKATQGTNYVDPLYSEDITGLRVAGERRGSYHYPNGDDPAAEAAWYVHHAGRQNGEMQALDFEGEILNHHDPVGWAAAFLGRVRELTNNLPLIYMSGSVCTRFDWSRVQAMGVGLWVASWQSVAPTHLGGWKFAIMWQRSDDGSLAGVHGRVDQDVFFGNATTWAAYANNHGTPAPPPPGPPKPTPPPAPTPSAPKTYSVQHGDTLSAIGRAHDVSVHQLVVANEHRYPSLGWNEDLIQVGWVLIISTSPHPPATYTVKKGDTLSGIATHYATTVAHLVDLNKAHYPSLAKNDDLIQVGWVLLT